MLAFLLTQATRMTRYTKILLFYPTQERFVCFFSTFFLFLLFFYFIVSSISIHGKNLSHVMSKSCLQSCVSDQLRLKRACSAKKVSKSLSILDIATLFFIILYRSETTMALIRLCRYASCLCSLWTISVKVYLCKCNWWVISFQ